MSLSALVSVTGPDRIGFVSAITARLYDLGANLGDTAFAVLGGGAEFTAICEFAHDMDLQTLKRELQALSVLDQAEVKVSHFALSTTTAASETITHTMTISGGDNPGLMARLCEVFEQFDANIVRLNSERAPGENRHNYVISAAVAIPRDKAQTCLATIANTAGELGLSYEFSEVST